MGNSESSTKDKNTKTSQGKNIAACSPTSTKCHYELLGVELNATAEELKRAYRQKALLLHPDKNLNRLEAAHHEFAAIQAAYQVLSDPQERAWYDRHRSSILSQKRRTVINDDDDGPTLDDLMKYFNTDAYDGYNDGPRGFFTVYRQLFEYLEEFEGEGSSNGATFPNRNGSKATFTSFGSKNCPYEPMVKKFYEKWLHFTSNRSFDQGDRYQVSFGDNRRVRRAMDKENLRERERIRREFSETVQQLAAFIRKRDPRHVEFQRIRKVKKEQEEAERRTKEKFKREEEAANFVEQDWTKVDLDDLTRAAGEFYFNDYDELSSDEAKDSDDLEEEEEEEEELLFCAPCKKSFKNPAQWQNHERSKKHYQKLFSMGINPHPIKEEEEEEEESLIVENVPSPHHHHHHHPNPSSTPVDDNLLYELGKFKVTGNDNVDYDGDNSIQVSTNHVDNDTIIDEQGQDDSTRKEPMAFKVPKSTFSLNVIVSGESLFVQDNSVVSVQDNGVVSKLGKKKGRRAKEKSKNSVVEEGGEEQFFKCNVCKASFPTRNQLFKHVREQGHELANQHKDGGHGEEDRSSSKKNSRKKR